MSSISVVIPTYSLNRDLSTMAYNCAKTYRDMADQLIVSEDGGNPSVPLGQLADLYLYHDHWGFTKNVNYAWRAAVGDYVFIVNSDTYIESGNYEDLCIPGMVTSPLMAGHTRGYGFLNGAFFVVPKEVAKERGMLNEEFKTWCSDDDFYFRVKDIFKQVNTVTIRHVFGATMNHMPQAWKDEQAEQDRQTFERLHSERARRYEDGKYTGFRIEGI